MFNWLGNLFPYSDLHSLNLDWILSKMKETATQAAQAIADSAKALAQVIEAKTAAQNAQTAAQNAQTAANKAAGNAASAAANAVQALNAAQTAQETATAANTAAETAQETANNTANKFPVQTADIADKAVTTSKIGIDAVGAVQISNSAKFKTEWKTATNVANVSNTATRYTIDVDYTMTNKLGEIKVDIADNKYIAILNRVMFVSIRQSNRITDLTLFNTETKETTHYWLSFEYDNGYFILVYKVGDLTTVESLPVTLNIRLDVYQAVIDK